MNKYIWCEDSKSGYQFWNCICKELMPRVVVEHKDGNTRIRRAAKNIQADGNEYYIIMDSAMDNPDVLREMRKLKQDISGKDNVHIISIHSFEFALLSFNLLESWVFAQEDELKDSRQDLLKMKTLFVKLFLSENSSSSLTDFKKTFETFRSKNSEQIAAKLLFEITRNTGFETDKSKLGECFVNDCCEWKNREEDDICGLDADRLSSKEKAKLLVEYSILKEAFERAGL